MRAGGRGSSGGHLSYVGISLGLVVGLISRRRTVDFGGDMPPSSADFGSTHDRTVAPQLRPSGVSPRRSSRSIFSFLAVKIAARRCLRILCVKPSGLSSQRGKSREDLRLPTRKDLRTVANLKDDTLVEALPLYLFIFRYSRVLVFGMVQ